MKFLLSHPASLPFEAGFNYPFNMRTLIAVFAIALALNPPPAYAANIHDLDGFVGLTDEDTWMAQKLIGMDLPKSSWSREQLHEALKFSERIIWDCSQQITAIDLNPELFKSAQNLKEDLIRERSAAVMIHNLAKEALEHKQSP